MKKIENFENSEACMQVKYLLEWYTDYAQNKLDLFKKPSEMYSRVHMQRQTYSDAMSFDKKRMPKKTTLMKFAIGLELDIYGFDILLERSGLLANKDDITENIIREHIRNKNYDMEAIEEEVFLKDPNSELIREIRKSPEKKNE